MVILLVIQVHILLFVQSTVLQDLFLQFLGRWFFIFQLSFFSLLLLNLPFLDYSIGFGQFLEIKSEKLKFRFCRNMWFAGIKFQLCWFFKLPFEKVHLAMMDQNRCVIVQLLVILFIFHVVMLFTDDFVCDDLYEYFFDLYEVVIINYERFYVKRVLSNRCIFWKVNFLPCFNNQKMFFVIWAFNHAKLAVYLFHLNFVIIRLVSWKKVLLNVFFRQLVRFYLQ